MERGQDCRNQEIGLIKFVSAFRCHKARILGAFGGLWVFYSRWTVFTEANFLVIRSGHPAIDGIIWLVSLRVVCARTYYLPFILSA